MSLEDWEEWVRSRMGRPLDNSVLMPWLLLFEDFQRLWNKSERGQETAIA